MSSQFQKVALWGRMTDPTVAGVAATIAGQLQARGSRVLVETVSEKLTDCEPLPDGSLADAVDLLVSIGGDGTILTAARRVAGAPVPILGVNLGRLGFLTDIRPESLSESIGTILDGKYIQEERLLLRASLHRDGSAAGGSATGEPTLAFNDVVLQKGSSGRMFDFDTVVGGTFVNRHSGDGLIVATPTGSTAYALSCGGPIIEPSVAALVMVPICPHTLSDRPLVIPASSKIEVTLADDNEPPAHVSCDGEEIGEMGPKDTLCIESADETVTLLHPLDYSYYELLRSKLNWGKASRSGGRERSM